MKSLVAAKADLTGERLTLLWNLGGRFLTHLLAALFSSIGLLCLSLAFLAEAGETWIENKRETLEVADGRC